MTKEERDVVTLYAVLARDVEDFLDMLEDAAGEVLVVLFLMLSTPNPSHDVNTVALNSFGAGVVAGVYRKRFREPIEASYVYLERVRQEVGYAVEDADAAFESIEEEFRS